MLSFSIEKIERLERKRRFPDPEQDSGWGPGDWDLFNVPISSFREIWGMVTSGFMVQWAQQPGNSYWFMQANLLFGSAMPLCGNGPKWASASKLMFNLHASGFVEAKFGFRVMWLQNLGRQSQGNFWDGHFQIRRKAWSGRLHPYNEKDWNWLVSILEWINECWILGYFWPHWPIVNRWLDLQLHPYCQNKRHLSCYFVCFAPVAEILIVILYDLAWLRLIIQNFGPFGAIFLLVPRPSGANLWHRSPVLWPINGIQCQLWLNFVTCPGCPPPFFFPAVLAFFSKPCPKMPHKILPPSWSFMVMNRWAFSAGGVFWPCVLGTAVLMLHSSARSSRARWGVGERLVHHKDVVQREPGWFRG